jgi:SAM-dependent methyltransferase
MELNPEDLAKITDFMLSHCNEHAEDFWEGTRDHNVNQNTRAHSGCEVWQRDFLKLDLPDRHFDGVFANAALFHVPGQELPRVLLELCASLKPGGVLFSSNPHDHNEEGWNGGRYGVYHDPDTWRSVRRRFR